MTTTPTPSESPITSVAGPQDQPLSRATKRLLLLGALAGPLYSIIGAAEYGFRDGLDITRHALSMATIGSYGWIQTVNFITTGFLVILAAAGLRHAYGSRSTGRLLAVHGAGFVVAGLFHPDPALGFPPGTPDGTGAISWHGTVHFTAGGIGFACFIATCLVVGRHFHRAGDRQWAIFSRVTGVLFLAAFLGIASGSTGPATLGFIFAVLLSWIWLTLVCRKAISHPNPA